MSSAEELEAAFKKAVKSLEGEKRAAIKKAKGTKGKKAKEALAAVEDEYASKLKDLQSNHEQKLAEVAGRNAEGDERNSGPSTSHPAPTEEIDSQEKTDPEMDAKKSKQEKARRKKERQKEREAQKQKELEEEMASAGPDMRDVELEQIRKVLSPLNLSIAEVEADGNCLYRAVGAQTNKDYMDVRKSRLQYSIACCLVEKAMSSLLSSTTGAMCADMLRAKEEEFAPFCEYTDEINGFEQYVDSVRNSSEWGGHLELRAIGMALDRPIHVYSLQSGSKPLTIHECDNEPIRLSYHLHYYALGEHYNQVLQDA